MQQSIEILNNQSQEFIDQTSRDFLYTRSMDISQWVRASREAAKLTQEQLAEKLGKTKSNVSGWENGRHEPGFGQIKEIARISNFAVPIPGFDQMGHANVAPAEVGKRKIPLISSVQAGRMTEAVNPFPPGVAFEYLLTDLQLSEHAFALEIEGQSMEPDFKEGDRIIVDPAVLAQPGDFVVAKNGREEATFKKYRPRGIGPSGREVFELVPLNPDYPTINSENEPARIIGVMVEHRRYRKR